ncbi:uncharacterized mitochondrial protein AtMg00820-like [Hibiscus syriacus]|uniref:uncharacterized mitochondrial protein AtMg00820-like n=1 Tax=Hibiscus syriacus TaxID=106335 RepID=UPI001923777A|nr:uncharacterized mitochondrial protein AtMg00820-like [Hibiscus syriacus]
MTTRSKHGIFKTKVYTIQYKELSTNIHVALEYPDWRDVVLSEYNALLTNNTWRIVELPAGMKAIGCKWLFKVKKNADGSVERLKTKLVTKGYYQISSFDLMDTFSPVVQFSTVNIMLSLVVTYNWKIRQVDVNNALKLDFSLFVRANDGMVTYVAVYVDNILVTKSSQEETDQTIHKLQEKFSLKDLGQLKFFLGIEVHQSNRGLFLSQIKFVTKLLHNNQLLDGNHTSTPMVTSTMLSKHEGRTLSDPQQYSRMVGAL